MSCTSNTKPIDGTAQTITLTTTPQDVATLIGGAIDPNAKRIVIHFNLAPAGKRDPLARMTRDINFALTATDGEPIYQGRKVTLTEEQFDALFRSVSGTIDAFIEFFDLET